MSGEHGTAPGLGMSMHQSQTHEVGIIPDQRLRQLDETLQTADDYFRRNRRAQSFRERSIEELKVNPDRRFRIYDLTLAASDKDHRLLRWAVDIQKALKGKRKARHHFVTTGSAIAAAGAFGLVSGTYPNYSPEEFNRIHATLMLGAWCSGLAEGAEIEKQMGTAQNVATFTYVQASPTQATIAYVSAERPDKRRIIATMPNERAQRSAARIRDYMQAVQATYALYERGDAKKTDVDVAMERLNQVLEESDSYIGKKTQNGPRATLLAVLNEPLQSNTRAVDLRLQITVNEIVTWIHAENMTQYLGLTPDDLLKNEKLRNKLLKQYEKFMYDNYDVEEVAFGNARYYKGEKIIHSDEVQRLIPDLVPIIQGVFGIPYLFERLNEVVERIPRVKDNEDDPNSPYNVMRGIVDELYSVYGPKE
jgi:hypothetical protein